MNLFNKLLATVLLLGTVNVYAVTTWVKSVDGLSATTSPSPYQNSSDDTETLTIAGATALGVSISGTLERFSSGTNCNWDWITITDNVGTVSQRYCDDINDQFIAVGPTVTLTFHSDGSVVDTGATVSIVRIPAAIDDSFQTNLNVTLNGNVLANDLGTGLFISSKDLSTLTGGSITSFDDATGDFTYVPNPGFEGIETFTYTIEDAGGDQSTATVQIIVTLATTYRNGLQPFNKVNPESTWNIRGNYKIAGNSVMCLTGVTNSWAGTCRDNQNDTNNNSIARYINIDGNTSTWNSSSSSISLPNSYEQNGGQGILWAGLFWSGRISTNDNNNFQRMGVVNGSGFINQDMTTGNTISIANTDANRLLLKIDTGNYLNVQANELYTTSDNTTVQSYAAYSDVTTLVQDANLNSGDHNFTIANLTSTEGQESGAGNFGGWSLVVIYAEDFNGKPRNISIYSGLETVSDNAGAKTIQISGFKLPAAGTVSANLSIFAGEGEWRWGSRSTKWDWMKISDELNANYVAMPGALDDNNIFDGKMTNISRPNILNNAPVNNNVGVEVDDYDVSGPMQGFRNTNPDIDTIYLRMDSNEDYINPTMVVFSTELYQPEVCYDYTYDFDGYVIPSEDLDLNTTYQDLEIPLTTHLTVRSIEGDFPLQNTTVTVNSEIRYLTYTPGSAAYAGDSINAYLTMYPPELNVTAANTFRMSIGAGATADGGTIYPFETHYMRFQHDLNSSQENFDTKLQITLDYTTDYGSGPVPIHSVLNEDNLCAGSHSYQPSWGIFNVINDDAPTDLTYNLRTQIVERPFNAKIVGYGGANYDDPTATFNTWIEVEVFNVDFFKRDSNLSCNNPDSNISIPQFKRFNNSSFTMTNDTTYDRANKNSAFRVWYLEDESGNLVNNQSANGNDDSYFKTTIYPTNYATDGNCTTQCTTGVDCYSCLRVYYGKPLCSRDNFSIRPESFNMVLSDNNQTTNSTGNVNMRTNTQGLTVNTAGAYQYQLDINATKYGSNDAALGYVQDFPSLTPNANGVIVLDFDANHTSGVFPTFTSNTNCNSFTATLNTEAFWHGERTSFNVTAPDVGAYTYHILDNKWTSVDNPGNYGQDCIADNVSVGATGDVGCNVSSNLAPHSDLSIRSYPYRFDTTAVNAILPDPLLPYIYSNQLNDITSPTRDENMSLRYAGNIAAVGADASAMTNFVSNCYSEHVTLDLDYTMTGETFAGGAWNQTNGTTANGINIRWRELNATLNNGTWTLPLGRTETMNNFPDVNLTQTEFSQAALGATTLDLYLNIDRTVNTPHNPIQASFNYFTVGCESGNCGFLADQNTSNASVGRYDNIAPVVNIFYGRAHAPRYRVQGNNANLTTFYEVYCQNCNIPRLQTVSPNQLSSVDDIRWFQNTIHTAAQGDIPVALAPMATQNPAQFPRLTFPAPLVTGATSVGNYAYDNGAGYPFKTTINYTPSTWLIYNRFDPNAVVNSFELEFFNNGNWSGKDNAGMNSGSNSATTVNRRIQW